MASIIKVKVDDKLKQKSDMLFKDHGIDTTITIRIFLTLADTNNGLPFVIGKNTRTEYDPIKH